MYELKVAKKEDFLRSANAQIQEPKLSVSDWESLYGRQGFQPNKMASLKKVAASSKYLLSHCTIMASVMTEADPFDYLVKPECSHLINNNEDGWTNEVLKMSHKSFISSFNFVEHYQNSKHAKGHLLDSILRVVTVAPDIWVYFCDILVATDMVHEQLVTGIINKDVRYMSMGCVTDMVICSYCGQRIKEGDRYCTHLSFQKGQFLPDDDGIPRRVAELCGHKSLPNGGVKFVEASWVAVPAFPGASLRGVVAEGWEGPQTPFTKEFQRTGGLNKAASGSGMIEVSSREQAEFKKIFGA
jgi:hypothetical protein